MRMITATGTTTIERMVGSSFDESMVKETVDTMLPNPKIVTSHDATTTTTTTRKTASSSSVLIAIGTVTLYLLAIRALLGRYFGQLRRQVRQDRRRLRRLHGGHSSLEEEEEDYHCIDNMELLLRLDTSWPLHHAAATSASLETIHQIQKQHQDKSFLQKITSWIIMGDNSSNNKYDLFHGRNRYGWTTLHCASYMGHVEVVQHILDSAPRQCHPTRHANNSIISATTTRDGDTALHLASRQGHVSVVKCLIEYSNNSLKVGSSSSSLPTTASGTTYCGSTTVAPCDLSSMLTCLLEARNQRENRTALLEACQHGRYEVVRYLMIKAHQQQGDEDQLGVTTDARGRTPLMHVVLDRDYHHNTHVANQTDRVLYEIAEMNRPDHGSETRDTAPVQSHNLNDEENLPKNRNVWNKIRLLEYLLYECHVNVLEKTTTTTRTPVACTEQPNDEMQEFDAAVDRTLGWTALHYACANQLEWAISSILLGGGGGGGTGPSSLPFFTTMLEEDCEAIEHEHYTIARSPHNAGHGVSMMNSVLWEQDFSLSAASIQDACGCLPIDILLETWERQGSHYGTTTATSQQERQHQHQQGQSDTTPAHDTEATCHRCLHHLITAQPLFGDKTVARLLKFYLATASLTSNRTGGNLLMEWITRYCQVVHRISPATTRNFPLHSILKCTPLLQQQEALDWTHLLLVCMNNGSSSSTALLAGDELKRQCRSINPDGLLPLQVFLQTNHQHRHHGGNKMMINLQVIQILLEADPRAAVFDPQSTTTKPIICKTTTGYWKSSSHAMMKYQQQQQQHSHPALQLVEHYLEWHQHKEHQQASHNGSSSRVEECCRSSKKPDQDINEMILLDILYRMIRVDATALMCLRHFPPYKF